MTSVGSVRYLDFLQKLTIPGTCMTWHHTPHRVAMRTRNGVAIHLVSHDDIAERIDRFVEWERTRILIANFVLIVAEQTHLTCVGGRLDLPQSDTIHIHARSLQN